MNGSQDAGQQPQLEGRNLVLFSDGTGNRGGKTRGTNVWRLYNLIDQHDSPVPQLAFYDDGVGTGDNRVLKLLGGAAGYGLTRNVVDLYAFLARHYRDGDRIYLFGFSRGAFTVRVLGGVLARCGLWTPENYDAEAGGRKFIAKEIVRAYRSVDPDRARTLKERTDFTMVPIRFIGVWDTVDAVGMPVDEFKVALEVFPRLVLNRRGYGFNDRELSGTVVTARQALSIDDDRRTFHPNVWSTTREREERKGCEEYEERVELCDDVEQVWFPGAHSNVGGGYPKDALAYVALDWMMGELDALGRDRLWLAGDRAVAWGVDERPVCRITDGTGRPIDVYSPERDRVQQVANARGRQYEPRSGTGMFYRYLPRPIERLYTGESDVWARWLGRLRMPECFRRRLGIPRLTSPPERIPVHVSALVRIAHGTQGYAPYVLPTNAVPAFTAGPGPFDSSAGAKIPPLLDHEPIGPGVRVLVAGRRAAYFVLLLAVIVLVALGLEAACAAGGVPPAAAAPGPAGTPGEACGWLDLLWTIVMNPLDFLVFVLETASRTWTGWAGLAGLAVSALAGWRLRKSLRRRARAAWKARLS